MPTSARSRSFGDNAPVTVTPKVLAIVTEQQAWLLARWQEIQNETD
jgi:hypothetical protein